MATHPYISGPGNIQQMIIKLKNNFPNSVTSATIKQLGIAPNNESSVINALQFIDLIDADGKKNPEAAKAFLLDGADFEDAFSKLIKSAYSKLFGLHNDAAWSLDEAELITFFRQTDQTSQDIGKRQAKVFKMFAALGGKAEPITVKPKSSLKSGPKPAKKKTVESQQSNDKGLKGIIPDRQLSQSLGLSIKIEVNLPTDASSDTYDSIFKSIREHLLDD